MEEKLGRLIITRRARESIVIGDNVEISINWIRNSTVSLAVTAPLTTRITRQPAPLYDALTKSSDDDRAD